MNVESGPQRPALKPTRFAKDGIRPKMACQNAQEPLRTLGLMVGMKSIRHSPNRTTAVLRQRSRGFTKPA